MKKTMSNLIRSTGKKSEMIEDIIDTLNKHKNNNFDMRKTNFKLYDMKKKYDIDPKKIRLGDLL